MNKKITRWSLMNILFAILVSIPLWSIVVRTGYVLLNKNAYQSYYGETINQKEITNVSTVENYNEYLLINSEYSIESQQVFTYDLIEILEFSGSQANYDQIATCNKIYLRTNGHDYVFYRDNQYITEIVTTGVSLQMRITLTSYSNEAVMETILKNITYNSYSYLDNVFDYSIDKFNSENDAHFDFVSTIANMFITEDSYGWRYVEFVNWYFNYFIVISAVYILFLAIVWFIAVSRRLIERSMNLW